MTKFTKFDIDDAGDEASELVKMNTSMAGDLIPGIEDDVKEGAGEVEVDVKKVIYDFQCKLRKIRERALDEDQRGMGRPHLHGSYA